MKRLSVYISIGNLAFDFVSEVKISSSWQTLTDTCTIELPPNIKLRDGGVLPQINTGDPVEVQLGFDAQLETLFTGYVSSIGADIPLQLSCEDEMYTLKRKRVTGAWSKVSLPALFSSILPASISYQAQDIDLGAFRIGNATVAQVLDELRSTYGIRSYFRNGILYCELLQSTPSKTYTYSFQSDILENNLKFRRKEDLLLKVRAVGIQPDNSRIEVEVGDPEGQERTLHYFNIDKATLQQRAEADLDNLKVEGYQGSFMVEGGWVKPGDAIEFLDNDYPDRQSINLVESVEIDFGQNGYTQSISVWKRVS